jgi:hypothetical protein
MRSGVSNGGTLKKQKTEIGNQKASTCGSLVSFHTADKTFLIG